MAKKKSATGKVVVAKKAVGAAGKGKCLTPEEKAAIAAEPASATLKELSDKYKVSVNSILRWRGKRSGRNASTTSSAVSGKAGVQVSTEGDFIVVRIPKKGLVKEALGELLG